MSGEIVLGTLVEDRVTGFKGVATARIVYLFGGPRVQVESAVGEEKGGAPIEPRWYHEERLIPIPSPAATPEADQGEGQPPA